ncbi:hypothetical protein [Dictyobacter alpinus]|nr:hypothetical protein [Dictyobacter alpinus]
MQNTKFRLSNWLSLCLCIVLFTLFLSACGSTQADSTPAPAKPAPTATPTPMPTPTPTPKPTTAFKGEGFTFNYDAAEWTVKTSAAGLNELISKKNPDMVLVAGTAPTQGNTNLDKVIASMEAGVKATATSFKEDPSAPATVKIAGQDWKQKAADAQGKDASGNVSSVKVYVLATQKGAKAYIMDYTLPAKTADTDQKELIQPILDSFKFV